LIYTIMLGSKEPSPIQEKARSYSRLKYQLAILDIFFLLFLLLAFLASGLPQALARLIFKYTLFPQLIVPLNLFALSLGYYLLTLPLNLYRSYTLEHKFSLSTQKIKDWLLDQLKAAAVSYIIALILLSGFYYILALSPGLWWLIASVFYIFFSLILARLAPILIVPIFFKYKRLSDETLKKRLLALGDKFGVRVIDCFEIDLSKKTLKANAALLGWGRSRRVILSDTLKDKYSYDEIEVILAHELAHYKLKHLVRLILINSGLTIGCFYLIHASSRFVLGFFGLPSLGDVTALAVLALYFTLFGLVMEPFTNFISRRFERKADLLALKATGLKEAFISMMEKLSAQNLADRSPHPLIKFFFFDHPPVDERIEAARAS